MTGIPLQIAGIKGMELIILAVIVIVVLFGANRIPTIAKSLGRATGEFTKGRMQIKKEIKEAEDETDEEKAKEKILQTAKGLGIDTEGKSISEIKKEILTKMDEEEEEEENDKKDDKKE